MGRGGGSGTLTSRPLSFPERFFCPAEVKGTSQQVPLWENLNALLHLSPATFFHIDPYFHYRFGGGGGFRSGPPPGCCVDEQFTSLAPLTRASLLLLKGIAISQIQKDKKKKKGTNRPRTVSSSRLHDNIRPGSGGKNGFASQ